MRKLGRDALISVAARIARRYDLEMRPEPTAIAFLKARDVDLVVDVGANEGQFARELRKAGYGGRIHSFEPVAAPFATLAARAEADPRWEVTRSAVGATVGTVAVNVSAATVYSSIRTASAFGQDRDGRMASTHSEDVALTTLDAAVGAAAAKAVFLKIDTQGYEREVLDGARALLASCVGLQLELPVGHLYDEVWDFDEALAFVKSLGFVPAQFRTVCTSDEYPAAAVEFDCIFRRAA